MSSLTIVISCLFLNSCEPPNCAWCYPTGSIHIDRAIEICADDQDDLLELVYTTESLGYDCDIK